MCDYYQQVFQQHGIVCDNTVEGGDCYGEYGCGCKVSEEDLHREWCERKRKEKREKLKTQKEQKEKEITFSEYKKKRDIHKNFKCIYCKILVCACCYENCPGCGYSDIDKYRKIEDTYTCRDECNGFVDCLCKIYEFKEDPHVDYTCKTCSHTICTCCFQTCPHCN